MPAGDNPSGLHLLGNGRNPANKKGDLVTVAQMEQHIQQVAQQVILPELNAMMQHYMRQVPELVARMLADQLAANGLEFKGPPTTAPATETPE